MPATPPAKVIQRMDLHEKGFTYKWTGGEKWGTEGAHLVRMRVGREKENHPRLQRMVKDRMVVFLKKKKNVVTFLKEWL